MYSSNNFLEESSRKSSQDSSQESPRNSPQESLKELYDWKPLLDLKVIPVEEEVSRQDLELLLKALGTGRYPIQGLDLMSNDHIDPEIIVLVAQVVRVCPTLVFLDLSDCRLGQEHAEALSELIQAIKEHNGLLSVVFECNSDLPEKNVLEIIDTIGHNRVLSWELERTQLTPKTALALRDKLVSYPTSSLVAFRCYNSLSNLSDRAPETIPLRNDIRATLTAKEEDFFNNSVSLSSIEIPPETIAFFEKNCYYLTNDSKSILLLIHEKRKETARSGEPLLSAFQNQSASAATQLSLVEDFVPERLHRPSPPC